MTTEKHFHFNELNDILVLFFQIMTNDIRRLPPPPLFTLRPPPKPRGSLLDELLSNEMFNGQCLGGRGEVENISSKMLIERNEHIDWFNLFLRLLAMLSVIFCILIAICILICLRYFFTNEKLWFYLIFSFRKFRKEEKQYKTCVMSASISSKIRHQSDLYSGTNEHCQVRH